MLHYRDTLFILPFFLLSFNTATVIDDNHNSFLYFQSVDKITTTALFVSFFLSVGQQTSQL
jgi:hypothetical protein